MIYTGIDPSISETGIAVIMADYKPILLETIKTKSNKTKAERLSYIYDEINSLLNNLIAEYGKENIIIAIEDYAWKGNQKFPAILVSMGEVGGIIRLAIHKNNLSCYKFSPGTVKMFITGKGRCEKSDVMAGIKNLYGMEIENNNIADAFTIAVMAKYYYKIRNRILIKKEELQPYQWKALLSIGQTKKKKSGIRKRKNIKKKAEEKQGTIL